jgi:hypothetical protein
MEKASTQVIESNARRDIPRKMPCKAVMRDYSMLVPDCLLETMVTEDHMQHTLTRRDGRQVKWTTLST